MHGRDVINVRFAKLIAHGVKLTPKRFDHIHLNGLKIIQIRLGRREKSIAVDGAKNILYLLGDEIGHFNRRHPLRYIHGRRYHMNVSNVRRVVNALGSRPLLGTSFRDLYKLFVKLVLANPVKAKRKFPHGIPDAAKRKVEFKIGFDRLRADQFVWNVLNGHSCKVRWFPSYDALEDFLRGRGMRGKLFRSYEEFVLWKYGE